MKAKISLNKELTTVIENEDSLIHPIIFAYDLSVEKDSKFEPIFTTYAKDVEGGYILYEKTLHKGERGFGVIHDIFKKKEEIDTSEINRRLYSRIIEHAKFFIKAYEEYILDNPEKVEIINEFVEDERTRILSQEEIDYLLKSIG